MHRILVPKLTGNDDDCVFKQWVAADRARVKTGDVIAIVETSKATFEVTADVDGFLHHAVQVGTTCLFGACAGYLFADVTELEAFASGKHVNGTASPQYTVTKGARDLMASGGIGLERLVSLGKTLIRREDIEALLREGGADARVVEKPAPNGVEDGVPLGRRQAAVARVVSLSHATIPKAFLAVKVLCDPALEALVGLGKLHGGAIGLPELLVHAVASTAEKQPLVLARLVGAESLVPATTAHVGVTLDGGSGLFIPVIKDAAAIGLGEVAKKLTSYKTKALYSEFEEGELAGGNIAISLNLDSGVVFSIPLIVPNQTCMVSLSSVDEELSLGEDGRVTRRRMTTLGLAYDHRVLNGAEAMQFMRELKHALESGQGLWTTAAPLEGGADGDALLDRLTSASPAAHAALVGELFAEQRSQPSGGSVENEAREPTLLEGLVTAVWLRCLPDRTARVGLRDNFFDRGGTSLRAVEILARLSRALRVKVTLADLLALPTVVGLATAIARSGRATGQITPEQTFSKADPKSRFEPFPLTDIQEAYVVGRSGAVETGRVRCHVYAELEVAQLDLARLGKAVDELVARHEMLRCVILPVGEQRVLETVPPFQIRAADLSGRSSAEVEQGLEAIRREIIDADPPADRWPLFEIRATTLQGGRQRLHFDCDMLIADAWSLRILARDLLDTYADLGRAARPFTISFRDYVIEERSLRSSDEYRRAETYWTERLASLPAAPKLPLARSAGSVERPRFVRREACTTSGAWDRIRQRASRMGVTPSGVVAAAFAQILGRWTRSNEFCVNVTLSNRLPLHPEVADLVGDFTSVVLLEVKNQPNEPFATRAVRLQKQLWRDIDHRQFSAVSVLRELARRDAGSARTARMPIVFTSFLGLERGGSARAAELLAGSKVAYGLTETPQVWLDCQCAESDGRLSLVWDVVEELFPAGLIDDMFAAFVGLLETLGSDEAAWDDPALDVLPAKQLEARRALVAIRPLTDDTLHGLFLKRVVGSANRCAVVSGNTRVSYDQLHRAASAIARDLTAAGVSRGDVVAVVMVKGWEEVAAVLGILFIGAAYLPVEADAPAKRIDLLLRAAGARHLVTQGFLHDRVEWPEGIGRVDVDARCLSEPVPAGQSVVDDPDQLAYVIYTSGSTGTPKGVAIRHRAVVNTIHDVNDMLRSGADDSVLAISSLNFDLSVYDIFGTLAAGGKIVLPEPSGLRDPAHWAALLRAEKITLWNSAPAFMEMLVGWANPDKLVLSDVKTVMLSGDWVPVSLPAKMKPLLPGADLVALGGATEASIWSIFYRVATVDRAWPSIPYGRPMANQQVYVLNDAFDPCPALVPGHILIGGVGLADGYWRDDELTQCRFVTHPRTGERLYRTGDLGKYLPCGNIEFLGREDSQTKISGHRVELGEVEATLKRHPRLSDAVVTAWTPASGGKRLAAYVVAATPGLGTRKTPETGVGPLGDSLAALAFKAEERGLLRTDREIRRIPLDPRSVDGVDLDAYRTRRTHRSFDKQGVSLDQLSRLLGCLRSVRMDGSPLSKSLFPSAGHLYPVQAYVHVKRGQASGLEAGAYYYHPKEHALWMLDAGVELDSSIHAAHNQPIAEEAAFSIFLVGALDAIQPMYGDSARDFCLLEAGYMSQLLMSRAPAFDIGLCPIGTVDPAIPRERFGLRPDQIFLHCLLGGALPGVADVLRVPAASGPQAPALDLEADIRRFLADRLPAYMVPPTITVMDRFPVSPNGKVDRKALPEPTGRATAVAPASPPRTDMERAIVATVCELIGRESIDVHANFIEIGIRSVEIVRLHAELCTRFGNILSVVDIFEHPRVSALAKRLHDGAAMAVEPPLTKDVDAVPSARSVAMGELRKRRQRGDPA